MSFLDAVVIAPLADGPPFPFDMTAVAHRQEITAMELRRQNIVGMPVTLNFGERVGVVVQSRVIDARWHVRVRIDERDAYEQYISALPGRRAHLGYAFHIEAGGILGTTCLTRRVDDMSFVRASTLPGASYVTSLATNGHVL